jgi:hypothetical protein
LEKDALCHRFTCIKLYKEYFTKEDLESFGVFKIGRQVIRTMKNTNDLVLVPKEETVLQG